MKALPSFRKSDRNDKVTVNVLPDVPGIVSFLRRKRILITILLSTIFHLSSLAQERKVLLSRFDSCHVSVPEHLRPGVQSLSVASPMVRVAYVIPSNRTPQPNGVANLQNAVRLGRQFFKEQMEQYGLGSKTFTFETEDDGVTPFIHVVHVSETDEYLRVDLWNRAQTAASNAGISLWAPGEVWVVIPETHVMFPDGSGIGGVALGAGWGSGDGGGVSMIGSNALPLFKPGMITDDTPYDGKVLPELGPYPMKQDVTFSWFEGTTLSSVASSWLGALWHETGHGFGLGHDFRNDDNFHGNLMGNGLRGIRGTLFPEKYPQDYTRLEYWTSLFLNVNHFFNSGKIVTNSPTVSHSIPGSVTPEQGLVHLPFQVSDPDGLSFAYVVLGGDMAAEMLLDGTTANPTFAIPYFRQGEINRYIIFTVDKQGNKTNTEVEFTVPGGNNQAPFPFIKVTPPVPGENQIIVLDATQSSDVDHAQSSLLVAWDVDNDGQFDTEPSTNKTLQHHYQNPGNYLIRVKVTDPAGAQTISTAVSVKIPGTVAQVCQGDVTLSSQAQVDAFNCVEVDGNLTISGNSISNLDGLTTLKKVSNGLIIRDNPALLNLSGLMNLTAVGGVLSVTNNDKLTDLNGFSSLSSIGSSFEYSLQIGDNQVLNNLDGFSALMNADGPIIIKDNPFLETINGFSAMSTLRGGIIISNNEALKSVNGFNALETISPGFFRARLILTIVNNKSLTSINGFSSLTGLFGARSGASVTISDNPALKNVDGLSSLSTISDVDIFASNVLTISNNATLENIDGLSALTASDHPDRLRVIVTQNPSLTRCCGLFNYLSSGGQNLTLTENGAGCTIDDVLGGGPCIAQVCQGDFVLSSQAEVDAFNCEEVTGSLTISGNDITNLNALSKLKMVGGHLMLVGNGSLSNVDGLSALTQVGVDASGFNPSASITISDNPVLKNLDGFSSLTIMRGPIIISGNPQLETVNGFSLITRTSFELRISNNSQLKSIDGFKSLGFIGSFFGATLVIENNASLLNVDGLSAFQGVGGKFASVKITNNGSLSNINGLKSLNSISSFGASLDISGNPVLKNLDGLASLTRIGIESFGSMVIENNASLENLDGLASLRSGPIFSPSSRIIVVKNPVLSKCDGLRPLLESMGSEAVEEHIKLGNINVSENGGGCTIEDIVASGIIGYDIVDTSGKLVRHLFENDILYLDDLKCNGQTIVANTTGQIGSVKFDLNNAFFMMQNASPYTLTGDNYGTYFKPWIPEAGAYTLTATPYSQADAGGQAGQPLTIHFTVKPGTAVVSYDIVNTSGTILRHLNEGDILFLDDLKANGQTIVASTTGEIGSVKFDLNNKFFMMQNAFPYTLTGDNYGTYFQPWIPHPGAYTLTATPYSKPDAGGCAGQPLTIHFMVKPKSSTAVVSYDIVDTSGKFVRRLNEGDVLYLADLKGKGQTIVANTTGQIGSVKFDVNNKFFMMQNAFPYTLTGDNYGTYFKPWTPQAGAYALTATPYSKSDAGGVAGRSLTIHLTVVDKNSGVAARMIGTDQEADDPEGDGVSGVTIYPVPVDNELFVRIDDNVGKDALISILTIQGISVYDGTYSKSSSINTADLRPGVYVMHVVGNNSHRVIKFIKK
jgi:hypothetical protein